MGDRDVSWAAGRLVQHLAHRGRLVEAINDEDGANPGAASYEQDRTSGHTTTLWCEEHQRDPAECHRRDLLCDGVTSPAVVDPTGEVGSRRADRQEAGQRALSKIEAAEARVLSAVEELDRIAAEWIPAPGRPARPTRARGRHRASSAAGDPGCESCARLNLGTKDDPQPWWSEPNYNRGRPTNFGGALPRRMLLCRPCAEWALDHGHVGYCVTDDEDAKPLPGRSRYPHEIHLPPVDEPGGECLRKKHSTGYWAGKKKTDKKEPVTA